MKEKPAPKITLRDPSRASEKTQAKPAIKRSGKPIVHPKGRPTTSANGKRDQNFPPRETALKVIARVIQDRLALDEVLHEETRGMSAREIAWLWEVTSGVCRARGFLEHVIDSLALGKSPTGKLRRRLMLAFYGIFFQDSIAPERVVDETVESIKRDEGEAIARFANAVLRKAVSSQTDWKTWLKTPTQK
ncbi:MAG: hypothetical protein EOP09_03945, partial [Proteobacteria bacterium]